MRKQWVAAYAVAIFRGIPAIWLKQGVPDFRGVWNSGWIVDMADGRYAEQTVDTPFTEWGRKLWEECTRNLPSRHCLQGRYAGSM